ncbi:MAG TPA: polyprenyl synthetase family protein [Candidatus Acidoferrales bacterium]|nr:polyprenyl synthetase family protein [Candidatus Acidoferrales bacterium]
MSVGTKGQAREARDDDAAWVLADVLELVEARLADLLRSREPLLTEISNYLVGSGGKRVRPAVTTLIFRACGGREMRDIVDVATALELIHSATLLHDDIIDNSETRRGKESALRRYGLARTLVTGDFVFSRAFQLCARFEERLINWAAEACISLTEGEIMQGRFRHNPDVTLADYLEIISRKTASIFQQGARTAASLAGASDRLVEAMADCGFNVGMTFQVVDDLLDIEGEQQRVGKPVGIDLRDGNPSLPIVLAIARDADLAEIFARPDPSTADIEAARTRIRAAGVIPEVRRMASEYGGRARQHLLLLPPSSDKDQLLALIEQLLTRVA